MDSKRKGATADLTIRASISSRHGCLSERNGLQVAPAGRNMVGMRLMQGTSRAAVGRWPAGFVLAVVLCASLGCGAAERSGSAGQDGPAPPASDSTPPRTSAGWTVTIYYTAVDSYHHGRPTAVQGCPSLDCTHGTAELGSYPADFVAAVHDEGAGRITTGPHAGAYLNWSFDAGFWLDTAARDTAGRPLEPYRTAAADDLPAGTRVTLIGCGTADGAAAAADVCARLRAGHWQIRDQFTPGLGGHRHLDLYIGEENTPNFTDSLGYITLDHAQLRLD